MNTEEQFERLRQWISIFVQLRMYVHDGILYESQMPDFEYFMDTYDDPSYSMIMPHYQESYVIINRKIMKIPTAGLGSDDPPPSSWVDKGFAFRRYNYWIGKKYYPQGSHFIAVKSKVEKQMNESWSH